MGSRVTGIHTEGNNGKEQRVSHAPLRLRCAALRNVQIALGFAIVLGEARTFESLPHSLREWGPPFARTIDPWPTRDNPAPEAPIRFSENCLTQANPHGPLVFIIFEHRALDGVAIQLIETRVIGGLADNDLRYAPNVKYPTADAVGSFFPEVKPEAVLPADRVAISEWFHGDRAYS